MNRKKLLRALEVAGACLVVGEVLVKTGVLPKKWERRIQVGSALVGVLNLVI